jgi:purine-binding chemotaxis protein CheW
MPDRPLPDASLHAEQRFLTFRAGTRLYALPAREIVSAIKIPAVARVPQSPKSLLGLANLRGAVVPLVSLRSLLGQAETATTEAARAIVLDGAVPIALAVDAVEALVTLGPGRVETSQAALAAAPGERLRGAFKRDAGTDVAKILDIEGLVAAAFGQHIRAARAPRAARPSPAPKIAEAGAADQHLLITFDVGSQEYALALEDVREIVPLPEAMAVAPRAEAVLLGVMAYRDSLLPLLSLRGLLGFPEADGVSGIEKVIVVPVGGALVGLVADRMRAVLRADAHQLDPAPAMLAARSGGEAGIHAILRAENGRRLVSVLSPDHLFREDVMQRLGKSSEAIQRPAPGTDEGETGTLQFLIFRLGEDEFGLPIDAVDEVARVPDTITRVPRAPAFLEGVVNLRGDVLPVVDQRKRFEMPPFEGDHGRRLVVVRSDRHRAGLIVDSVSQVLRARADAIETAPDLTPQTTMLVSGIINLEAEGRMILLLNPAELLSRTEHGLLDDFDAGKPLQATA